MKIHSLRLACFSPTGTTRAVLRGIARGFGEPIVELRDITTPDGRRRRLQTSEDELLIVGVPVYMGRVPALLREWLYSIEARHTPAVCVVVYGNRAYEDALIELKDVLTDRGCRAIAGAAFIGEHSFSSTEAPTAEGRPDAADLRHAESFGRAIREKLASASSLDELSEVRLPGNSPYGGITALWSVDFIAVGDECEQCGICAAGCPVGAIDPEDSRSIDEEACITCCACIKGCPRDARTMKDGPVKDAALRLSRLHHDRRQPEAFV